MLLIQVFFKVSDWMDCESNFYYNSNFNVSIMFIQLAQNTLCYDHLRFC